MKDGAPVYHSKALAVKESGPWAALHVVIDDVEYRFDVKNFYDVDLAYEEGVKKIATQERCYLIDCTSAMDHSPIVFDLKDAKAVDGFSVSQQEKENLKRAFEAFYIKYDLKIGYIYLI